MTEHHYPLEGGSYRVVDGVLVRDAQTTTTETPNDETPQAETHDTTPAARGRFARRED